MAFHPIIRALRRYKAGVLLIVLQIALTLALVCNAFFIIAMRIQRVDRPTGVREAGLIRISQTWLDVPDGDGAASVEALDALQRTDLATLRQLPDVLDVAASDSMPLQGAIWSADLRLKPDQRHGSTQAALYYGDEHMLPTLGLRLIAGRNFSAAEIDHHTLRSTKASPVVIVTRSVADTLFPSGDALGKTIYLDVRPSTIVGIVDRLQTPTVAAWGNGWAYNSVLLPVRLDGAGASYALRVRPGRERAAIRAARAALFAVNPVREMPDTWGIQTMQQIRSKAYRGDRGTAILLGTVCLILLGVTGAGIVGLTSFWVSQRQRQIGIRRALGARRIDILHYFQIENLLIASAGVGLGVLLAALISLWLMTHYAMPRIPPDYVMAGALVILGLGQLAVFVPARRASNVPPVVAARSV
jgi:putative ABC transport system permease protein